MTLKLLIVDESELVRASLVRLFSQLQGIASIAVAATLEQALACARRESPALIIMDLHLPDSQGTQGIIRLAQVHPAARIAVLCATPNAYRMRKCLECGADWFFDKAGECDQLLEIVRRQVALSAPRAVGNPTEVNHYVT